MIEETIRVSGKFQVEIKSDYRLERDRRHTAYSIETYAFIPNSLDVNVDTYPKYLFYRDTQTYVRLRLPIVPLRDLASDDSDAFRALEQSLRKLATDSGAARLQHCENQLRLFCCSVKYSVKSHIGLIGAADTPADAGHLAEYFLDYVTAILRRFRELAADAGLPAFDERVRSVHAHADEYCSMFAAQYAFDILEVTRKFGGDNSRGYRKALLELVRAEEEYRVAAGYPSVVRAGSNNEEYIYRRGVLKRMMEGILFLDTRVRPEGRVAEQVIFSLAAGLAMMFATAVAFLTQQKYGNFTMAFFVALVVSYMFKDRIKELVRLYVNNKVQGRYFDRKRHIYCGSGGTRLGFSRERFQFVAEAGLRPEIRGLRVHGPSTRISSERVGEKVFLYRKTLQIFSRNFDNVYHSTTVDGLTDIWRISMVRFVRKMDIPRKPLFVLDDDGYRLAKASKVYHINLVIRYVASHGESYRRYRVVLNRNGIKRIEKIDPVDNG